MMNRRTRGDRGFDEATKVIFFLMPVLVFSVFDELLKVMQLDMKMLFCAALLCVCVCVCVHMT